MEDINEFSNRLTQELSALSWSDRNGILMEINRQEQAMRQQGLISPQWKGPKTESKILGANVVAITDSGERRGRVVYFGSVKNGDSFEKTAIVHVESSGTNYEVAGSNVRLATQDDIDRMNIENEMAIRLQHAKNAVDSGLTSKFAVRRSAKVQKDPEFVNKIIKLCESIFGLPAKVSKNNMMFLGTNDRRIYVFTNQLRVDFSNFIFESKHVRQIDADEAKEMHLGKVKGQVIFENKDEALEAIKDAALLINEV